LTPRATALRTVDYKTSNAAISNLSSATTSWGRSQTTFLSDTPTPNLRTGFNLPQVVRFMGSVEWCPIPDIDYGFIAGAPPYNGFPANPPLCNRPTPSQISGDPSLKGQLTDPGYNVKPDILGFLRYVNLGFDDSGFGWGADALTSRAWRKAGPIIYPDASTVIGQVNASTVYNVDGAQRHPSDVILLLSQRWPDAATATAEDEFERNAIRDHINQLNNDGARVIVIFFARGPEDEGTFDTADPLNNPDSVMKELEITFCANDLANANGNWTATGPFTHPALGTSIPKVSCTGNGSGGTRTSNVVIRISPGRIPTGLDVPISLSGLGSPICSRRPPMPFPPIPAAYNNDGCYQQYSEAELVPGEPSIEGTLRGILEGLLFRVRYSL
ncbi:MAG: hypothetical protein KDD70_16455, partial [Bdellovibrionales bacterium]|nr:hypothetical protein [Bdellovibrionales bacterium]